MKRKLSVLTFSLLLISCILQLLSCNSFAAGINNPPLNVISTNSVVSTYPYKLIIGTNLTLSDNNNGTASISASGGGGGGGSGTPAGSESQVQYNASGSFGASNLLTFRATDAVLQATGTILSNNIGINNISPKERLEITGNSTVNGNITATGNVVATNTATSKVLSVNTSGGNYYLPYTLGATGQVPTLQTNGTSIWQTPTAGSSTPETDPVWNGVKANYVPYVNATGAIVLGSWDISGKSATYSTLTVNTEATTPILDLTNYIDLTGVSNPVAPIAGHARFHAATTQGFTRFEQDNEAATNLTLGQDNVIIAKNTTASTINALQVVYVTGSTGNVPNIGLAKADSTTTLPSIGVALDNITNGSFGQVMKLGVIKNVDTSAFSVGDQIWVSPTMAGGLVNTRPAYPSYVQRMGSVLVSGVGNGSLLIATAPFIGTLESGTNATNYTFSNQASGAILIASTEATDAILNVGFPSRQYTLPVTIPATGQVITAQTNSQSIWQTPDTNFVRPTRTINTTFPIAGGGNLSADRTLSMQQATSSASGYISSTDWTNFNNKSNVIDTTKFVPYSGATSAVVLGGWDISGKSATFSTLTVNTEATSPIINVGTAFQFPTSNGATGQVLTANSGQKTLWQSPKTYLSSETDPIWSGVKANYVPYSGATGSVILFPNYDVTARFATANILYASNAVLTGSATSATFYASTFASAPIMNIRDAATTPVLNIGNPTFLYSIPTVGGATGQVITLQTNGTSLWQTPSSSSSGYNQIQDEGSNLTQRTTMNFTGTGVTASDSGGITVVNIPGASNAAASGAVAIVFDGGGAAISTAATAWIKIPYTATLNEWELTSFSTPPILVIDVWKTSYNSFQTATGTSITGTSIPTLTSVWKNNNKTLPGWTTSVTAGDYLFFQVNNIDTATYAVLTLSFTK